MTSIKNERYIPLKNYFIAIGLVVVVVLVTWLFLAMRDNAKKEKISVSYLVDKKVISQVIKDLDEAIEVLQEAPNTYFLIISYTGDQEVYNMEKSLEPLIKEYNLNDKMYYLDITKIKDDKNLIAQLNTSLGIEEGKITQVPTIVYFTDGEAYSIKRIDNNLMNDGDFKKLLDEKNIRP